MFKQTPTTSPWLKLFLCLLLVLGVEYTAGIFTSESVGTWYTTLEKPDWTPPNWVFPVAWTILYILMGVSLWLVWLKAEHLTPFILFFTQLFLNFLWSPLFFTLRNPFLGLITITLLWVFILTTIISFYRVSRLASILLVPYIVWVTYAAALNVSIWLNN